MTACSALRRDGLKASTSHAHLWLRDSVDATAEPSLQALGAAYARALLASSIVPLKEVTLEACPKYAVKLD